MPNPPLVCMAKELYFHVIWPQHWFQSKCQFRLANSRCLHLLDNMKNACQSWLLEPLECCIMFFKFNFEISDGQVWPGCCGRKPWSMSGRGYLTPPFLCCLMSFTADGDSRVPRDCRKMSNHGRHAVVRQRGVGACLWEGLRCWAPGLEAAQAVYQVSPYWLPHSATGLVLCLFCNTKNTAQAESLFFILSLFSLLALLWEQDSHLYFLCLLCCCGECFQGFSPSHYRRGMGFCGLFKGIIRQSGIWEQIGLHRI
jgi:hypothetical protein